MSPRDRVREVGRNGKKKVDEIIARPGRTISQATPAVVFTEFWDSFIRDLTERQYGAMVGLLTVLFSFLFVVIERVFGFTLLRSEPPAEVPVADAGVDNG